MGGAVSAGAEIQRFDLFKLEKYTGCISFSYEDGGEIHTTDPKTTICPISPSYIDVSSEYNIMVSRRDPCKAIPAVRSVRSRKLIRKNIRYTEDDRMKQYIVDAFTNKPFSGNPAAVCVMDKWPSEEFMKNLAMENNLSETAFIVKEEQGYHLRWFTPGSEVELCGHATLASSFVILNYVEPDKDIVEFHTLSGKLTVKKKDNLYEMDFPTYEQKEIPVTDEMESAFGVRPVKAVLGPDLLCIFDSEEQIRSMKPDQSKLAGLPGRGQNVTAKGKDADCISRSFFPKLLVAEDPVCGSAHCQIVDYWSKELGKTGIHAYQASKRGGHLYCEMRENGRIAISGEATLVAVSEILSE